MNSEPWIIMKIEFQYHDDEYDTTIFLWSWHNENDDIMTMTTWWWKTVEIIQREIYAHQLSIEVCSMFWYDNDKVMMTWIMMIMMMMITFQDCGDYLKIDWHASAQCRNSARTQASLKAKRYHNNVNPDLCIDDNQNAMEIHI